MLSQATRIIIKAIDATGYRLRDPRGTVFVAAFWTLLIGVTFAMQPDAIDGPVDIISAAAMIIGGTLGLVIVIADREVWHWQLLAFLLEMAWMARAVAWTVAVVSNADDLTWFTASRILLPMLVAFLIDRLFFRWVLPTMAAEVRLAE